jgi:hypothetical protein
MLTAYHQLSLRAGEICSQPILRQGILGRRRHFVGGVAMDSTRHNTCHLFEPGIIVGTPGAIALLERYGISPGELLSRHLAGDWGEVNQSDRQENCFALENGLRIMSVYRMPGSAEVIWIITECDRSATTLLRPEDY